VPLAVADVAERNGAGGAEGFAVLQGVEAHLAVLGHGYEPSHLDLPVGDVVRGLHVGVACGLVTELHVAHLAGLRLLLHVGLLVVALGVTDVGEDLAAAGPGARVLAVLHSGEVDASQGGTVVR